MENENIRKDEELQEIQNVPKEASADINEVEIQNSAEELSEDAALAEEEALPQDTEESIKEDGIQGVEIDAQEAEILESAEGDYESEETVGLTEEELAALKEIKRRRRKKGLTITAIVAAVIAIMVYFVCAIEGVGSKTIVSVPLNTAQAPEAEESLIKKALATDNIRYQNPISNLFDKVTGRNKDVVMTINGEKVDAGVFNYVTNSSGINSVYTLMQMGTLKSLDEFNWDDEGSTSGLSYLEFAKGMAVDTLIPYYAVIAEGKKRGIVLDSADEEKMASWIAEQKAQYGDEFEDILKRSGYADEDALKEVQRVQAYMEKVYADMSNDVSKYLSDKDKKTHFNDDKVTVKHILVQFEADEEGNISDEAKASAKKRAEEVFAKARAGEDFDKLVEEYNQDPGATDEGYTFANDGSMVQSFADASFALEVGGISDLVETPYGYHIIKRLERKVSVNEYLEMLKKNANVSIKKDVYSKIKITINLEDFFAAPEEAEEVPTEDAE